MAKITQHEKRKVVQLVDHFGGGINGKKVLAKRLVLDVTTITHWINRKEAGWCNANRYAVVKMHKDELPLMAAVIDDFDTSGPLPVEKLTGLAAVIADVADQDAKDQLEAAKVRDSVKENAEKYLPKADDVDKGSKISAIAEMLKFAHENPDWFGVSYDVETMKITGIVFK